jgi:hypothetical protein
MRALVILLTRHAKRMGRIMFSVACVAPQYSPHYLLHGTIFRKKKVIENKMFVSIFSTAFICNISHSKKN